MPGLQRNRGFLASQEGLERLKAAKFERDHTYESLAEAAGVSDDQVKNLYNPHWGRAIQYEAIERIARVLGLQPTDIVISRLGQTSGYYVERKPYEDQCYEEISRPDALIRIKAPKQTGKTWLMSRVLKHAEKKGDRTVSFNLREAIHDDYTNLDQFLRFFCTNLSSHQSHQEDLPTKVDEHWDHELGNAKVKCRTYFEKYLLAASEHPLVLGLDELDRIYPYPAIAEHFLGMLRTWHESARTSEIWTKLRLIVVYRETYTQLSPNQSPFNIGKLVELPEFTHEEVCELVQKYGLHWNETQVTQLMEMVSGLPNLVHAAVYYLKTYRDTTLEGLLATAPTFEGIYSEHLQGLLQSLRQQPEPMTEALRQVMIANQPVQLDWEQASRLHSMGLVKLQGNQVTPSCELYRQYFCEQLCTA